MLETPLTRRITLAGSFAGEYGKSVVQELAPVQLNVPEE